LEAAALLLTVSAMGRLLASTGDHRLVAIAAAAIWSIPLVAATIRTVVAWRRLQDAAARADYV
jgi:hypothetical protein